MKVLFTAIPSISHLYPIIPLAGALRGAGHEVCVASHPDMVDTITAAGLTAVPVGEKEFLTSVVVGSDGLHARISDALAASPLGDGGRPPRKYMLSAFSLYYPSGTPDDGHRSMVDDLVRFALSWRPDLVIWDPLCLPSPIAARACGAAHARLLWGVDDFAWTRARLVQELARRDADPSEDVMVELMRPTLDRYGYEFDEEMLVGQWTIDPMPARMRLPLDLRYVGMRSVPFNGAAALPDWLQRPPERPRVCLTLGVSMRKFFSQDSDIPVSSLFDMVADLDIELVATLNETQLPPTGSVPDNVRLVDYIPLTLLLPSCSAVIHHGGGGTFATAVASKVPQLVCPEEGADFDDIASHVVERGAGLMVERGSFSGDAVRKQLVRILDEPSFAAGAAGMYEDMLAAPSPNDLVPVLERLTAQHRRPTPGPRQ